MMNSLWTCPAGILGTPGPVGCSPAGHHVMAFIPVLYLSKVCYEQNSKFCRCVHCACAFTKAVYTSTCILVGLLCKKNTRKNTKMTFPKPDYKRRTTDWGAAEEALGQTSFELVLPVLRKKSAWTSHCHPSGGRADPLCQQSAQSLYVSLLIHQQHCSQDPRMLRSRNQGWM